MSTPFSSFEQYNIVHAEISDAGVRGSGAGLNPKLHLSVYITVDHGSLPHDYAIQLSELSAQILVGSQPFIRSHPLALHIIIPGDQMFYKNQNSVFEFDLNPSHLNILEKFRDGGPLKLGLSINLHLNKLRLIAQQKKNMGLPENTWGHIYSTTLNLSTDILISRDRWTQEILPLLGHGKIHLVELPSIPLEKVATFDHAFKALQQAQNHHRNGFYDDAVGKCRVALDQFFEQIESKDKTGKPKKVPALKKSWETKLGKSTYDWLNNSLGAVKDASNTPHHSPNEHYDQFESQMIIAITTNLVAFAARYNEIDS